MHYCGRCTANKVESSPDIISEHTASLHLVQVGLRPSQVCIALHAPGEQVTQSHKLQDLMEACRVAHSNEGMQALTDCQQLAPDTGLTGYLSDHLALAGSIPFKLGLALAVKSSVLDLGSRSRCMGEAERQVVLVCGTFQSASAGISEKRT